MHSGKQRFQGRGLILTPSVFLGSITTISKGALDIGFKCDEYKDVSLYISKPSKPREENISDWSESATVNPYFWVSTTNKASDANVVTKVVKENGVSCKVLRNTKNIARMTKIQVFHTKLNQKHWKALPRKPLSVLLDSSRGWR